jgi:triosephosphate isomerase
LKTQVLGAFSKLSEAQKGAQILLAYEPVWAIGEKGIPASPDYADARQAEIVSIAQDVLGRRIPCLYGGSVNPGNCEELISCPNIDGLFIGRSAWSVEGYLGILAQCTAKLQGDKQ